jgi:anhydro-N-acetylmuramic acid kinase
VRVPPKSTGRDLFNLDWLRRMLEKAAVGTAKPVAAAATPASVTAWHAPEAAPRDAAVVQSTLLDLVCRTIADACRSAAVEAVFVCGGGRRNAELMQRLEARLAPTALAGTEVLGVDPQAVEALAFAWLAWRRLQALPGNLPAVTGARGERVLGALYPRPPAPR